MCAELAWHFVGSRLRDRRPVPPDGEWLVHEGDVMMCWSGLHASRMLIDALNYAPGRTICRVAVAEIAKEHRDKLVARRRAILWRLEDSRDVLHDFARQAALSVLHLTDVLDVVREYLESGDESLRDAARGAPFDNWSRIGNVPAWYAAATAAAQAVRGSVVEVVEATVRATVLARGPYAARDELLRRNEEVSARADLNVRLEDMVRAAAGNPPEEVPK